MTEQEQKEREAFVSASCGGEKCSICGSPSSAKVEETIFHDDPHQNRHPLTAYVCREHFEQIMDRGGYTRHESARIQQAGVPDTIKLTDLIVNATRQYDKDVYSGIVSGESVYVEGEASYILEALAPYIFRPTIAQPEKAEVVTISLEHYRHLCSQAAQPCIDEGCPHYGQAINCEPREGGCVATVPAQPNKAEGVERATKAIFEIIQPTFRTSPDRYL